MPEKQRRSAMACGFSTVAAKAWCGNPEREPAVPEPPGIDLEGPIADRVRQCAFARNGLARHHGDRIAFVELLPGQ